MPPPLPSLQLRRLLLRTFTSPSSTNSLQSHSRIISPNSSSPLLPHPRFSTFPSRFFSSETKPESENLHWKQIALSFSKELTGNTETDPHSISQRFNLSFAHITPSPDLIRQTLYLSPEAGRAVLGFNEWLDSKSGFSHTDKTISYFVDYFGRTKDFNGMYEIIGKYKGIAGAKTLESTIDRLIKGSRAKQVVSFFEKMEIDYGIKRDRESLTLVVKMLCEKGHAGYAEKMVNDTANEIFPDEKICDLLISGWCKAEKLIEATRLGSEMIRGGFAIGTNAYNSILDCVCKLSRKKDPFIFQSEVEKVLLDMDYNGVPRNTETFNVLIFHLCKLRKTEEAMKLFGRMGEWGCQPDAETYVILIRSLYLAGRIGEGDEMIEKMKSAGFGKSLTEEEYHGFLLVLCGTERIEHAMSVFKKMKGDNCKPGLKTYELLIRRLSVNNQLVRANALYKEAARNGVVVTPKEYEVDPRFLKKKSKEVDSNVKKRPTLPEKTKKKKKRVRQIKLSFVKKPRKQMRRQRM